MRRFAISLATIALAASACSTPSQTPSEEVAAPQMTSTTVPAPTTTTPPIPSLSAEPGFDESPQSPLADRVASLDSALYDPQEHAVETPTPVTLTIPSLDIDGADIIDVGVTDDGEMEIPDAGRVGWYRYNPVPGESGSAVLAAHISFDGRPGVFRYLAELVPGDEAIVTLDDGTTIEFRVVETAQYPKDDLPVERVFAKDGSPILTLITCGGAFDRTARSYKDNIVAYAVPVNGAGNGIAG